MPVYPPEAALGAASGGLFASFPSPSIRSLKAPAQLAFSPPTTTLSAAAAASSIASSAKLVASDAAYHYFGHAMIDGSAYTAGAMKAGYVTDSGLTSGSTMSFIVEFDTDADQFELSVRASFAGSGYRLWVDGQPCTAAHVVTTGWTDNNDYLILVNFGARGSRNIRVDFFGVRCFNGVYIAPTSTIWSSSRAPGPKAVFVGDSFLSGPGNTITWTGWGVLMAQRLGWDAIMNGVSGTGYTNDGGGAGKTTYITRFAADVTPLAPNIVVFCGGVNDNGQSSAAVQAAATALFAKCALDLPNAYRYVVLPNAPHSMTSGADTMIAIRDGVKAACDAARLAGATDLAYTDPINYPSRGWITGTGRVGTTTGDGNGDFFTSSDNIHPSQAGSEYLGKRAAEAFALELTT